MDERDKYDPGRDFLKPKWQLLDSFETDQELGVAMPPREKPFDPAGTRIPLAPKERWKTNGISVVDAILNRKSRRKYAKDAISLAELSFLLFATQGVRRNVGASSFRTVPSAGARHSFETYLYLNRVEGVPRGLYRYLPMENELYLERPYFEGMEKGLDEALEGQFWNAAAYFVWTTIPYRTEWRYSIASHKVIAIDAGHICQNLYLACEAVGCGTCGIGAYRQELMDAFLGVDGQEEFTIYAAPVGKVE